MKKDIKDLQTILDNAEAYADTHNLRGAVFNAVDRIRIHSPRNQVRKILLRIIPIQPPKRTSFGRLDRDNSEENLPDLVPW